jgi:hypothetical protein
VNHVEKTALYWFISLAPAALWFEFNQDAGLWTIPKARMTMHQAHLAPLSGQAISLLLQVKETRGGSRQRKPSAVDNRQRTVLDRQKEKPPVNTGGFGTFLNFSGHQTGGGGEIRTHG